MLLITYMNLYKKEKWKQKSEKLSFSTETRRIEWKRINKVSCNQQLSWKSKEDARGEPNFVKK